MKTAWFGKTIELFLKAAAAAYDDKKQPCMAAAFGMKTIL